MKLGLWNRLAIVAGVLITLFAPTWLIITDRQKIIETHIGGYRNCVESIAIPGSGLTHDYCYETWLEYWTPGWLEWFQAAGFAALFAALLYGLIWSIVWTAKWVWRGKNTKAA